MTNIIAIDRDSDSSNIAQHYLGGSIEPPEPPLATGLGCENMQGLNVVFIALDNGS